MRYRFLYATDERFDNGYVREFVLHTGQPEALIMIMDPEDVDIQLYIDKYKTKRYDNLRTPKIVGIMPYYEYNGDLETLMDEALKWYFTYKTDMADVILLDQILIDHQGEVYEVIITYADDNETVMAYDACINRHRVRYTANEDGNLVAETPELIDEPTIPAELIEVIGRKIESVLA